jgi:hypothetical protein
MIHPVGSFVTQSDIQYGEKKAKPQPDPQPEVDKEVMNI